MDLIHANQLVFRLAQVASYGFFVGLEDRAMASLRPVDVLKSEI